MSVDHQSAKRQRRVRPVVTVEPPGAGPETCFRSHGLHSHRRGRWRSSGVR